MYKYRITREWILVINQNWANNRKDSKFKFEARSEWHNWKWTFVATRRGLDRSEIGVETSQCLFIKWNPNKNLLNCGSSKLFQSSSSDIICWLDTFIVVMRAGTHHWFHSFSRKRFFVFSFWKKNFIRSVNWYITLKYQFVLLNAIKW